MQELLGAIITEIEPPMIVHSEKGRHYQMKNRRCFGVSLCLSGQIIYSNNGKQLVSTQNEAIILPKGSSYIIDGDREGFFPVVNFQCDGFTSEELVVIPLRNPQACIGLFETLQKAFVNQKSLFYIFSVFYQLLDEIASQNTAKHSLLVPALKYIEQNLSDCALTNQNLAEFLGISEVYLRKLFLHHLNTTPKQYILNLRMQKARQLLTDTTLSVSGVSDVCGFSSVYHFSREFKLKTGLSPTQYAAANRIFKI